jgi:hypothetical protein
MDALDLIMQLLVEKEHRICSRAYTKNDYLLKDVGGKVQKYKLNKSHQSYQGYFVYDNDAAEIKRHAFFDDVNWNRLHETVPPFPPTVTGPLDTKYFDDEGPISDIDSRSTSEGDVAENSVMPMVTASLPSARMQVDKHRQEAQHIVPPVALNSQPPKWPSPLSPRNVGCSYGLRNPLHPPFGSIRERSTSTLVEQDIQAPVPKPRTKKKDRRRPRDIILRDPETSKTALEVRKLSAFLGYHYRRPEMDMDIVQKVQDEDPYGMPYISRDDNGVLHVDEDTRVWRQAERATREGITPERKVDPIFRALRNHG